MPSGVDFSRSAMKDDSEERYLRRIQRNMAFVGIWLIVNICAEVVMMHRCIRAVLDQMKRRDVDSFVRTDQHHVRRWRAQPTDYRLFVIVAFPTTSPEIRLNITLSTIVQPPAVSNIMQEKTTLEELFRTEVEEATRSTPHNFRYEALWSARRGTHFRNLHHQHWQCPFDFDQQDPEYYRVNADSREQRGDSLAYDVMFHMGSQYIYQEIHHDRPEHCSLDERVPPPWRGAGVYPCFYCSGSHNMPHAAPADRLCIGLAPVADTTVESAPLLSVLAYELAADKSGAKRVFT